MCVCDGCQRPLGVRLAKLWCRLRDDVRLPVRVGVLYAGLLRRRYFLCAAVLRRPFRCASGTLETLTGYRASPSTIANDSGQPPCWNR